MKRLSVLINEQEKEVVELKETVIKINSEKIAINNSISGALLTGSVARGDARIGSFGIHIDLALVLRKKSDINIEQIFGKDEQPYIPYHCVSITDKVGLAIEIMEENDLWKIREMPEPVIFAKNESIILDDKKGILEKWKKECFAISEDQKKQRALNNYFRFNYLTGDYRLEKWSYREAWIQIAQNFNEANECYCNFLYCINGMFIPRKDWLTYLTYEMEIKPDEHEEFIIKMYESQINDEYIKDKNRIYQKVQNWMELFCREQGWLR